MEKGKHPRLLALDVFPDHYVLPILMGRRGEDETENGINFCRMGYWVRNRFHYHHRHVHCLRGDSLDDRNQHRPKSLFPEQGFFLVTTLATLSRLPT